MAGRAKSMVSKMKKSQGGVPKKITAKQKVARQKNIEIARRAKSKAKGAFASEYKKTKIDKFVSKDYAVRRGHEAAVKANKVQGSKMAMKYAMGVAMKKYGMTKSEAKDFAQGYVKSLKKK